MKKTLISNVVLFLVLLCTGLGVQAQIGMGTPTPRGALDINRPTTNTWGLVLPTNSSTNNIVNPMGGNVAVGTLMYDSTLDCMRVYRSSGWSDCVCICPAAGTITTLNCSGGTFAGTLLSGNSANGANGTIPYTGGSGGTYSAFSVASTGVTGLTLSIAAGSFASGNGSLSYIINGTPSASGTASFAITIGGQSCMLTLSVASGGTVTALDCSSGTSAGTLMSGTAASGVSGTILYTGGNGGAYNAYSVSSIGVSGLTLNISVGSFASGAGSLSYTITGTPSASGTASFPIVIGGQSCVLTRTVSVTGTITTLDCSGGTSSGNLVSGTAANGVSGTILYTGGNGGAYSALNISSTGVTGLTLSVTAGSFASGSGSLSYTITGTPSGTGTASFAVIVGGKSCTLTKTVNNTKNIVWGYTGQYPIGASSVATFNTQMQTAANYGTSGIVKANVTFTDVTSDMSSLTATQLYNKYSVIYLSVVDPSAADAQKLYDYVTMGGVLFVGYDIAIGSVMLQKFGGTGSVGTINAPTTFSTNSDSINNGVFGDVRNNSTLSNTYPSGIITSSQLPSGARIIATVPSNSSVATFITGTGGRAIFVFDELAYLASGTVIDTPNEIYFHNLVAYAISLARSF